ncbi:MAG: hypothetical protein M3Q03_18225 [Chloroflexota bacterium]|nr:hypothetical protein [Chloroflexota bacterium]
MRDEAQLERQVRALLDRVPGYRGYRAKEDRRDADRRVRDHLVTAFGAQADRVERVARDLAAQRRIQDVGPVDAFARRIRHLCDRIRTATYGYGGLFSDRDVDAAALDQLRQFDEALLSGVEELNDPIEGLEAALVADGDLKSPARAGEAKVHTILARLDLRDQVVETAEPAPEASVLEVLQPQATVTPSPAFDLRQGDAVSILGDDHLIDAQIDVRAGDASFRLHRLQATSPDQWLLVRSAKQAPLAQLSATKEPFAALPTPTIGTAPFQQINSGSGRGELIGSGGSSGERRVTFTFLARQDDPDQHALVLDWGNERQVLVGRQVHPGDVEAFPRAGGGR